MCVEHLLSVGWGWCSTRLLQPHDSSLRCHLLLSMALNKAAQEHRAPVLTEALGQSARTPAAEAGLNADWKGGSGILQPPAAPSGGGRKVASLGVPGMGTFCSLLSCYAPPSPPPPASPPPPHPAKGPPSWEIPAIRK